MDFEGQDSQSVWEDEAVGTPRLPDPVRDAAVRAALVGSFALVGAVIEVLLAAGHSWLSAPMMLFTVLACVVATWAVLDVWVTRQVWNQRNGVVSSPSSAARALRRERRRARRSARLVTRQRASRRRPHRLRIHGA
ncbi:hypothetical protein [Streptomyces sp. NBC_01190]|uniref:hypothetical protein n=1 Tax=Streptomyces sp. NBC_01190 TaxID=2903767 RepID=UPI00386C06BC|nr:hypothetical protein OG519_03050 [Streptomyces sp. NBC_01190]